MVAEAGPPRLVGGPPLRTSKVEGSAMAVVARRTMDAVRVWIC